jgi:glycosyltransferase involved in cell wall biosynthesis
MRVLVLVSRDPLNPALGGGETVMAEFARALVTHGHEVHLLCASFPSGAAETEVDGIHVHRLAPESVLGAAAYIEYLRRFRGRVDIVLEEFLGGARIPFFASLYVREPLISLWFQDHLPIFRHEFSPLLYPVLAGLDRVLLWTHRGSFFLAPSTKSRADLISKGADPDRVRVYLPGVSEASLESGPPPPASAREPRIVCLGKIRRYKSQHHAILVLKELVGSVPEASLVIAGRVGDPAYLEEMRALSRQHGLAEKVSFELRVTEERKRELLRTSRACLAPAPIEGFGIAIVEAGACGLPVVGTNGVPEDALQEGVNGFRVAFGDIGAMADRTRTLLTDDAAFDGLAVSSHRFASQFTWERASEPLLDLLREIVPDRR